MREVIDRAVVPADPNGVAVGAKPVRVPGALRIDAVYIDMACEKAIAPARLADGCAPRNLGEVRVQASGRGSSDPRVLLQRPGDAVADGTPPNAITLGRDLGEHDGGTVLAEAAGKPVLATLQPDGALRAGDIDILESREIGFTGEVVHSDRPPRYGAQCRYRHRRRSLTPRPSRPRTGTLGYARGLTP